jgi:hypothetical protein
MDCREMVPIVHGLENKYSSCMNMQRVHIHAKSVWHELLSPVGAPEFVLLRSSEEIIHRWSGYTEAEEFAAVLDPLCGS